MQIAYGANAENDSNKKKIGEKSGMTENTNYILHLYKNKNITNRKTNKTYICMCIWSLVVRAHRAYTVHMI